MYSLTMNHLFIFWNSWKQSPDIRKWCLCIWYSCLWYSYWI